MSRTLYTGVCNSATIGCNCVFIISQNMKKSTIYTRRVERPNNLETLSDVPLCIQTRAFIGSFLTNVKCRHFVAEKPYFKPFSACKSKGGKCLYLTPRFFVLQHYTIIDNNHTFFLTERLKKFTQNNTVFKIARSFFCYCQLYSIFI